MAQSHHTKAAEHHDAAAKSHRTAAEHHGKNDHAAATRALGKGTHSLRGGAQIVDCRA